MKAEIVTSEPEYKIRKWNDLKYGQVVQWEVGTLIAKTWCGWINLGDFKSTFPKEHEPRGIVLPKDTEILITTN